MALPKTLFPLTAAAFALGTTEFVVVGLLPTIADDTSVSVASAGTLVTAYAAGIAIGGPLLSFLLRKRPPRSALIALLVLFVVAHVGMAVASSFIVLLVARVVAAATHGAFFGIAAVMAVSLVEASSTSRALALMFGGLTIATVLGVPLGTLLGQATNWRVPFVAVALLGGVAALWIAIVEKDPPADSGKDDAVRTPPVNWPALGVAFLVTSLGFGSMFVVFTFISTYLVDVTGLDEGAVPVLLLVYGAATAAGTLIGGQIGDRWPNASLPLVLALLAVVLAAFDLGGSTPWSAVALLVLWGLTGFALPPLLQARVIEVAGAGSTLASTLNVASFNVGIAAGSIVGTALVEAGHLEWTPAAAAVGTALAVPLALKRRRQELVSSPPASGVAGTLSEDSVAS
jgi:DHA1 family inner membrane transport protein